MEVISPCVCTYDNVSKAVKIKWWQNAIIIEVCFNKLLSNTWNWMTAMAQDYHSAHNNT